MVFNRSWFKGLPAFGGAGGDQGSAFRVGRFNSYWLSIGLWSLKAQQSMDPVLTNLKDYVLYLKHNLNAQAIGALRAEVRDIELDIQTLIADMNKSIQEADEFLKNFQ